MLRAQMIRHFVEDREVVLYCDMHGHSRKRNIFIYGCENKVGPRSVSAADSFGRCTRVRFKALYVTATHRRTRTFLSFFVYIPSV